MARKKNEEINEAVETADVMKDEEMEKTAEEKVTEAVERMERIVGEPDREENIVELMGRLKKDLAKVGIELCKHMLEYYSPINEDTRESIRTAVMICEMLKKTGV